MLSIVYRLRDMMRLLSVRKSQLHRKDRAVRAPRAGLCIVLGAFALASCGKTPSPDDSATKTQAATAPAAIDLPEQVANFKRMDVLRRQGGHDVTAGYSLGDGTDEVIATVRVHSAASDTMLPWFTDHRIADPSASAQPLQASLAQVRHFYPRATLRDVRPVYLVKRGQLQGGRAATLRYEDLLAGQRRKIDLDIYVFCCVDGRREYEFRIRHAADNDVGPAAVAFMQALSWSPDGGAGR